jgi:hypothetical protein
MPQSETNERDFRAAGSCTFWPTLLGGRLHTLYLFAIFAVVLVAAHAPLLRLPYFWDEAGYYVPAARDLLSGSLIPHSTPSNAHPPLVLAWLALCWKIFGFHPAVTRSAMLLLAAFSLLGFYRLALTVSNFYVAASATFLTAIYPVFFAQSSLAQVDLPAAGLIFWGLESYVRGKHCFSAAMWFSLAALAKETAILVPVALFLYELIATCLMAAAAEAATRYEGAIGTSGIRALPGWRRAILLLTPVVSLGIWYRYHYLRTGFVFGNPEFFRYNLQATLHPLRIFLALLIRLWQTAGYMNLYVLTVACLLAMRSPAIRDSIGERSRIAISIQLVFLSVAALYIVVMSVIGGAVLARYMLPIVPLVILICVSTVWRRLQHWKIVLAIVALAFISGWFVNPPYGFAPEDNLAYRDYIHLHQAAERWLQAGYTKARVLTAWPASGELTLPYVGYVEKPMKVIQIEDFTAEQLLSAAETSPGFDVAMVFSTKYETHSMFDRWTQWQEWKSRYFGFHRDLPPEAAASVLGGKLVYVERKKGQWVGIIEIQRIEQASKELFSLRQ